MHSLARMKVFSDAIAGIRCTVAARSSNDAYEACASAGRTDGWFSAGITASSAPPSVRPPPACG
jgi:hypothetical protein